MLETIIVHVELLQSRIVLLTCNMIFPFLANFQRISEFLIFAVFWTKIRQSVSEVQG